VKAECLRFLPVLRDQTAKLLNSPGLSRLPDAKQAEAAEMFETMSALLRLAEVRH
jgi:hypothetical protein